MRELSTPDQTLFDASAALGAAPVSEMPAREEKRSENLAKEFVRWCFSFGNDFRNSPDIINLRSWAKKAKLKLRESEESDLLIEARKNYLKRVEQTIRKAEVPTLAVGPEAVRRT